MAMMSGIPFFTWQLKVSFHQPRELVLQLFWYQRLFGFVFFRDELAEKSHIPAASYCNLG